MTNALVFNIQKFCLHDGPGIRTIVFFKGCPLHCKWCSNPESQSFSPELIYYHNICIQCFQCAKNCPLNAISTGAKGIEINRFLCNQCGVCIETCPSGALKIAGESLPIESIMSRIRRDRHYYENSAGGITLSGGEPLAQPEAALALLSSCKREGFHTAVETCGYVRPDILVSSRDLVDLYLFDIKEIESSLHKAGTGVNNELIISNLTELINFGSEVVVRVPLIPTFNLQESFYEGLVSLIIRLGISNVEVVPYHRLGLTKYDALGRSNELGAIQPVARETCRSITKLIRDRTGASITVSH